MYRIQRKLVPLVTSYLGVYSIRSRLSRTNKSTPLVDQIVSHPAACEVGLAEEDPFPNSTRPYGKRLGAETVFPAIVYGNTQLFSSLDTTCAPKDTTILRQDIAGADVLPEYKRYNGFIVRLQHVYAMVKRYLLIKVRDINRLANLIYFPVADIIVAGLVSYWMARNSINVFEEQTIYLVELACWIIINATHVETCFNFIEEIQTRNVINLFSSSLQHFEWIIASLILSSIEAVLATGICSLFLYGFYGINLYVALWWYLPLFLLLMIMSGWIMAVATVSLMLKFGLRMTILTLALPYIIMPLSAAFYPLSVLPGWLQSIAYILPTTYIFEGLRILVMDHVVPTQCIAMSLVLNVSYIVLVLFFYNFMFKKSMEQGLSRLESE